MGCVHRAASPHNGGACILMDVGKEPRTREGILRAEHNPGCGRALPGPGVVPLQGEGQVEKLSNGQNSNALQRKRGQLWTSSAIPSSLPAFLATKEKIKSN